MAVTNAIYASVCDYTLFILCIGTFKYNLSVLASNNDARTTLKITFCRIDLILF